MLKRLSWFLQISFLVLATGLASEIALAAIFAEDSMSPILPSNRSQLGSSIAIALLKGTVTVNAKGSVDIASDPLGGYLCPEEKFSRNGSIQYACTGFLVGPDLLLTAGHCVYARGELKHETKDFCPLFDWMFDYRLTDAGKMRSENFPAENLYHCKEIIYAVEESSMPYRDYALIRLDREVKGRKPLKLSRQSPVIGEPVRMAGHPLGMPAYLSDRGQVTTTASPNSFLTNLDAVDGFSGSPIVNHRDEVIGILVAGTPSASLVMDEKRQCARINRCNWQGTRCTQMDEDTSRFIDYLGVGSQGQRVLEVAELVNDNSAVAKQGKESNLR